MKSPRVSKRTCLPTQCNHMLWPQQSRPSQKSTHVFVLHTSFRILYHLWFLKNIFQKRFSAPHLRILLQATTSLHWRSTARKAGTRKTDFISLIPTTTTSMLMTRMANQLYQARDFLMKRMLTKMRFVPVSISKDEAWGGWGLWRWRSCWSDARQQEGQRCWREFAPWLRSFSAFAPCRSLWLRREECSQPLPQRYPNALENRILEIPFFSALRFLLFWQPWRQKMSHLVGNIIFWHPYLCIVARTLAPPFPLSHGACVWSQVVKDQEGVQTLNFRAPMSTKAAYSSLGDIEASLDPWEQETLNHPLLSTNGSRTLVSFLASLPQPSAIFVFDSSTMWRPWLRMQTGHHPTR